MTVNLVEERLGTTLGDRWKSHRLITVKQMAAEPAEGMGNMANISIGTLHIILEL